MRAYDQDEMLKKMMFSIFMALLFTIRIYIATLCIAYQRWFAMVKP